MSTSTGREALIYLRVLAGRRSAAVGHTHATTKYLTDRTEWLVHKFELLLVTLIDDLLCQLIADTEQEKGVEVIKNDKMPANKDVTDEGVC